MRASSHLALLVVAGLLISGGLVAASPILAGGEAVELPVFSVSRVRTPLPATPARPATEKPGGFFGRMLGYRSAQADETAPARPTAAPSVVFHHAALGVATLDAPSARGVVRAEGVRPVALPLDGPALSLPAHPTPLPIPLLLALILGPSLLLVVQALRGGPKVAVRPARRRPPVRRRG